MSLPLLVQVLRGQTVPRPPVWMMRQAGRYLPEYMALRSRYDFFTRVQTPELACQITLQPIDIIGPDAAILFSDILVVPQAMGLEVQLTEGKGPYLPRTIATAADLDQLVVPEAAERLDYVYQALRLVKRALPPSVALLGFAGAPFTILCYLVEGKGSKAFDVAKQFCFAQPQLAHRLLDMITEVTIAYLRRQVAAGADAVQVFDSWSGLLAPADFATFAQPYLLRIAQALAPHAPVILFPKGSWYALPQLAGPSVAALGIDWAIAPAQARAMVPVGTVLQGNFDPNKLLMPPAQITQAVRQMIADFGPQHYVANLGHGILPNVP
ncbi:MAG: uroporphyrinogen decarboxylase, partial [Bernardetiaceae bacterium]|nr:uroporphyrinogen decarboxylase [Bernardetiaceae bacterium]